MNKMHEIAGGGALMPRFDDGMVNMAELIRVMAESLVNKIMDTQADEACEAGNRPPTSGSMLPASRAAARAGRSRPRPPRSHSRSKETSASSSRPPAISPPMRKEPTSFFSRDLVPTIIVSIRNAESGRNQLVVFRQLEKAAVCARLSKKTVDLCELDHPCDTSLIE